MQINVGSSCSPLRRICERLREKGPNQTFMSVFLQNYHKRFFECHLFLQVVILSASLALNYSSKCKFKENVLRGRCQDANVSVNVAFDYQSK